jgi:hypothetical protein
MALRISRALVASKRDSSSLTDALTRSYVAAAAEAACSAAAMSAMSCFTAFFFVYREDWFKKKSKKERGSDLGGLLGGDEVGQDAVAILDHQQHLVHVAPIVVQRVLKLELKLVHHVVERIVIVLPRDI